MQEHIITKEDGSKLNWSIARNNNAFCLLYKDNNQKYKFTPTENLNCELFMIGGGGAGGYFFGGGGGAGAAYINNNYTFKKNKTYTFEIGSGGMCDIENINELFKSGLTLNIYNNTNVNLNNVNFIYDDYTSLGIENSGMEQTFNINNITIPASIFKNNTTYIWDGYIKSNSTGYFNININSRISTIIWVDKYIFNNANSLISADNINDVKILQLDANRYYNIKIIAYNNNSTSNNFNITFEGCQFFNFDKTKEIYKYKQSTDTTLTYQNDNNTFETLRCKGGGNGGCGFYNKNSMLDGGCGGGSGINKIKGSSIIEAIYNGYDGAVGDYCGGGGGIISAGNNNRGGNGKIINWFNNDLIFGAGGNAANLNDVRNLGYGSGGNGGECCYYSKLLINNNGNNGCILIYINSPSTTQTPTILTIPTNPTMTPTINQQLIENFSVKDTIMLPKESIANKLIEQSFQLSGKNSYNKDSSRADYFGEGNDLNTNAFVYISNNYDNANILVAGAPTVGTTYKIVDRYVNETYIYDILVINRLFAIFYRLYTNHFKRTLANDLTDWKNFINDVKIKMTVASAAGYSHNITTGDSTFIEIMDINAITSLKLGTDRTSQVLAADAYNRVIYNVDNNEDTPNIADATIENYIKDEGTKNSALSPLYHNIQTSAKIPVFDEINTLLTANKYYKIIFAGTYDGPSTFANRVVITPNTNSAINTVGNQGTITLKIFNGDGFLTRDNLTAYYNDIKELLEFKDTLNNYLYQRILLYLEIFNKILNTDPLNMLATLKYNMHYYNLIAYNASIQWKLLQIQNLRIIHATASPTTFTANTICYDTINATASPFITGSEYNTELIKQGVNTPTTSLCPTGQSKTAGPLYVYGVVPEPNALQDLNDHINILETNISKILEDFNDSTEFTTLTTNITDTTSMNKNSTYNYYNEQLALNKAINDYNNELENYNNLSYYYKIVIAFGIVLLLLIIVIFNFNGINNNSKISIYGIIIIMIIIAYILYNQFSGVKEGFTAVLAKGITNIVPKNLSSNINFSLYKQKTTQYMSKLLIVLTNGTIGGTMKSSLNYIKRISDIKNDKAEYYKIKKMNLINSMEVLKKTSKYYYNMIILIAGSIIIFNTALILYLLSPSNIIGILLFSVLPFIILIFYISYQIHKSTRLAENKNYWANYNPSDNTLNNL